MLVPLRNTCWIFVKLSGKLCAYTFISASTEIFLMDAKIQKIFNVSFVFYEKSGFQRTK